MTLPNSKPPGQKPGLKICLVAPFGLKTKGTTAARVIPIAEALVKQGHRVRVVVPPWDDPAGSPDLTLAKNRLEKVNGLELVFVPVKPGPQPLRLPVRLVRAALAFKPDVVHIFKPKAFSGLAALLLSLSRRPFVLDSDDWEGPGGYNDLVPYSFLQKKLFAWQERDLPARAAAVTVASRTLQTQVWGFGVKPEQVLYLPNGIAPEKYANWTGPEIERTARQQRVKLGLSEENLVLLAYTRFVEFKMERLLRIFRLALAALPPEKAAQARLLVVGGGFRDEDRRFMELARAEGLDDKIIRTGTVQLAELPALLACGDIALYPFDDNLINRSRCSAKFLDLLMAGLPVVTEAVGELPNYLQDGRGGYLIPPGNEGGVARAVAQLAVLSRQARQDFGRQAASRLEAEYTWDKLVAPLEDLYWKSSH
jgi:glycosyltransferase involved in cell wall biosynthesis